MNFVGREHALSRLGAQGGFMGHVVLAVSVARPVSPLSDVGKAFKLFSKGNPLYMLDVAEVTRGRAGLSENTLVFYTTLEGRAYSCGEIDGAEICVFEDPEEMNIWLSQSKLGDSDCRRELMQEVLKDMRQSQQSWSWSTAVRAFLLSGELSHRAGAPATLKQVQDGWEAEPICTSVVVTFWQKYLYRLAEIQRADPLDMILNHMPLQADCVLPGELLCLLQSKGWILLDPEPMRQMSAMSAQVEEVQVPASPSCFQPGNDILTASL